MAQSDAVEGDRDSDPVVCFGTDGEITPLIVTREPKWAPILGAHSPHSGV